MKHLGTGSLRINQPRSHGAIQAVCLIAAITSTNAVPAPCRQPAAGLPHQNTRKTKNPSTPPVASAKHWQPTRDTRIGWQPLPDRGTKPGASPVRVRWKAGERPFPASSPEASLAAQSVSQLNAPVTNDSRKHRPGKVKCAPLKARPSEFTRVLHLARNRQSSCHSTVL